MKQKARKKQNKNTTKLDKAVKNVAKATPFQPHKHPIRWKKHRKYDRNHELYINESLTVYGIYARYNLNIQNDRKWAPSTCQSYDRCALLYLLPRYPKKGLL